MFADLFVARNGRASSEERLLKCDPEALSLSMSMLATHNCPLGQPHRKHTDPAVSCVALLDVVKWPEVVIVNVDGLKVHCPW